MVVLILDRGFGQVVVGVAVQLGNRLDLRPTGLRISRQDLVADVDVLDLALRTVPHQDLGVGGEAVTTRSPADATDQVHLAGVLGHDKRRRAHSAIDYDSLTAT